MVKDKEFTSACVRHKTMNDFKKLYNNKLSIEKLVRMKVDEELKKRRKK